MSETKARPRMVIYLDDPVKDWWEDTAKHMGVKPSTFVAMLLTSIANSGSSPISLLASLSVREPIESRRDSIESRQCTNRSQPVAVLSEHGSDSIESRQAPPVHNNVSAVLTEHILSSTSSLGLSPEETHTEGQEKGLFGTSAKRDSIAKFASGNFDAWWALVPRKKSKAKSRKPFEKSIAGLVKGGLSRDEALATIMQGVARWAAEGKAHLSGGGDPKHLPHPSTWLSEERWEDEPDPEIVHVDSRAYVPEPGETPASETPWARDARERADAREREIRRRNGLTQEERDAEDAASRKERERMWEERQQKKERERQA